MSAGSCGFYGSECDDCANWIVTVRVCLAVNGALTLRCACDKHVFKTQADVVKTSSRVCHMVSTHRVYHSSQGFTSKTCREEIRARVGTFRSDEHRNDDFSVNFLRLLITYGSFSSFLLQFMRHQRQNLPVWIRLTMALFGFLFPREALIPRLRGQQRWRDFLLPLPPHLGPCFPNGTKGSDLREMAL